MTWLRTWLLLGALASPAAKAADTGEVVTDVCPQLRIAGDETIKLSAMEKRLVCGDRNRAAWGSVPGNEASFALRSFLQTRGYYHPVFQRRGPVLRVQTGEPTKVRSVAATGAPAGLDISRYWRPLGERLTPKLLNDLEAWVRSRLRADGYACPVVSSSADPETGDVVVGVTAGAPQIILSVTEESVPGLMPGVLRRNDAFKVGDRFNGDLLTLTARRTMAQELLLSTNYTERCGPDGVAIAQTSVPGPPRLAQVGVGFNTEQLFLVKGLIRNSRLGPTASVVDLTATASRRLQQVVLAGQWFYLPLPSRLHLEPAIDARRDVESSYESRSVKVRIAPAATFDGGQLVQSYSLGPAYEMARTVRGTGPGLTNIVSVDGHAHVMTHAFEFYQGAPRQGFQADLSSASSRLALGSMLDADRLHASGEVLWNVAAFDPPIVVVGVRAAAATTVTGGSADEFAALPPSYRHFLGGAGDLRGFARQALPSGGNGALTTAYAGLEVRLASVLPQEVQPFVFTDAGETGRRSLRLAGPLYLSPGLGVRWQSPVGPVRVSAAHGLVRGAPAAGPTPEERWSFYFSFGEEF